jgi:hypothetical protein
VPERIVGHLGHSKIPQKNELLAKVLPLFGRPPFKAFDRKAFLCPYPYPRAPSGMPQYQIGPSAATKPPDCPGQVADKIGAIGTNG